VVRRLLKLGVAVGVTGGLIYVIARAARATPAQRDDPVIRDAPPKPDDKWTGLQATPPDYDHPATTSTALQPDPDAPRAPVVAVASAPWVEPADGRCPSSHPVKGKLTSRIFHLPGMLNYERTTPDRCYLDAAAAEADGLRAAKR
jgi:hypothetical protein